MVLRMDTGGQQAVSAAAALLAAADLGEQAWCRLCRDLVAAVFAPVAGVRVWLDHGTPGPDLLPPDQTSDHTGARRAWMDDQAWAVSPARRGRAPLGLGEFVRGVWPLPAGLGGAGITLAGAGAAVSAERVVVQIDYAVEPTPEESILERAVTGLRALRAVLVASAGLAVVAPRRRREAVAERVPRSARPVLPLLIDGLTEEQIGMKMQRSKHTVHDYVKAIYLALGVRSRLELLRLWVGMEEKTEGLGRAQHRSDDQ